MVTYDSFVTFIQIWVTHYLPIICLATIAMWATGNYLWVRKWQQSLRDSSVYLLAIGLLSALLALRPQPDDVVLWAPLTWFGFAMLLVIELLWIAYLIEGVFTLTRTFTSRSLRCQHPGTPPKLNSR